MRTFILILALIALAFAPTALASPAQSGGSTTTNNYTGSTSAGNFSVSVTFTEKSDGSQSGSISIKGPEDDEAQKHDFTYISFSETGLEGYFGEEGGGVSLTLSPDGDGSGSVTIPGVGAVVIKQK